ncbi:MAG: hypothetical protein HC840_14480 [Leptolyngbyaceae cyanobacterium RM2_2_4]|nr:hypothetical protein [Leptolyngbyaceae cyanobacterium SM1_4_3]NJO50438.1 hypothetical protein [Leptolyngbyaceae cyanobacterium RM2_2_4]NJO75709.1 hypothetical protein [Leptolyngbyaceae cyanobacterium RM1_406_9]
MKFLTITTLSFLSLTTLTAPTLSHSPLRSVILDSATFDSVNQDRLIADITVRDRSDLVSIEEQGSLSPGTYQSHIFQGVEGEDIDIEVTGRQFRPLIELYDADGQLVGSSEAARRVAVIELDLPTTGQYTLVVKGTQGNDGGDYQLVVEGYDIRMPSASSPSN